MKTCTIEGCDKPLSARGWCGAHYARWARYGDPQAPISRHPPRPGASCKVNDCARPAKAMGLCSGHYQAFRNRGVPELVGHAGPNNGRWTGDAASYNCVHQRVRAQRGRASDHACACGQPAAHWAYDHTDPDERWGLDHGISVPYSTDPARYVPMCVPCHKKFDLNHIKEKTA